MKQTWQELQKKFNCIHPINCTNCNWCGFKTKPLETLLETAKNLPESTDYDYLTILQLDTNTWFVSFELYSKFSDWDRENPLNYFWENPDKFRFTVKGNNLNLCLEQAIDLVIEFNHLEEN